MIKNNNNTNSTFWLVKLIYEPEQLEYLCIFDSEQKRLVHTWMTWRNCLRILFVSILVVLIVGWFALYRWGNFQMQLENWGILSMIASLTLTGFMPYSHTYRRKTNLMALNHALISFTIVLQIFVTFKYWFLSSAKDVMKSHMHKDIANFYQYCAHIIPAFACLYNFCITDFLFYRRYAGVLLILTLAYFAMIYANTQLNGNKQEKLRWVDYRMILHIAYLCLGSVCLPYFLANLSEISKARRLPIIEKH